MERFKSEVPEKINAQNSLTSQVDKTQNGNNNTVFETRSDNGNTERNNETGIPQEQTQGTPKENVSGQAQSEGTQEKKKGRGRPPLTPEQKAQRQGNNDTKLNKDPANVSAGTRSENSGSDAGARKSLIEDLSKYKKVETPASGTQTPITQQTTDVKIELSKFITGALLLIVMDGLMPGIVLYIAKLFDAKYKRVKAKKLRLTFEEKRELEPLADELVKVLFGFVHPAVAFLIATGALYAGKLISLEDSDFEPLPKKEINNNDNDSQLRQKETRKNNTNKGAIRK